MRNVYMFRNVREVLVKDVNTPPPPPPPWWSYDSMCNMLKNPIATYTPILESLIFEICNPSKGS